MGWEQEWTSKPQSTSAPAAELSAPPAPALTAVSSARHRYVGAERGRGVHKVHPRQLASVICDGAGAVRCQRQASGIPGDDPAGEVERPQATGPESLGGGRRAATDAAVEHDLALGPDLLGESLEAGELDVARALDMAGV